MNPYYPNNNFYQNNYCAGNIPEVTSNGNHMLESKPYPPKAVAYINPRIVNYQYLKQSLGQCNKIHFNPNFKPTGIGVSQQGDTQTLSKKTYAPLTVPPDSGCNLKKCEKTPIVKLTSQFKVVNKRYPPENQTFKTNKYSWFRKDIQSKNGKSFNTIHSNNTTYNADSSKTLLSKPRNLISGNKFKFVAAKKTPQILNSKKEGSSGSPAFLSQTKIIAVNGKKLINKTMAKSLLHSKSPKKFVTNKIYLSQRSLKYTKNNMVMKAASQIKNKYKYNKTTKLIRKSKYKIDKRQKISANSKKLSLTKKNDIRNLFPIISYRKIKYFYSNIYVKPTTNNYINMSFSYSWRKNQELSDQVPEKKDLYLNRRLVKIGGILYKSTSKKLTLAKVTPKHKVVNTKSKVPKKKSKKNYTVYVRGEKFLLDINGKTLIRQEEKLKNNESVTKFKRIDIGGVTYLQKSQNVLIRTNMHKARRIVNQAKHKSIATLCHLRKKSAFPCMIYHKFGKCIRHDKGLCMYKHDSKNIAVCKKFLKGECDDKQCLLSHEVIKEKMATCSFYLNGCCIRENCPFLHVKLNKNVDICDDFLHGFCNLGQNCSKRHLFQCPEFDKYGKCKLGTKCLFPHKTQKFTSKEKSSEGDEIQYNVLKLPATIKLKSKKTKRAILKSSEKNKNNETDKKGDKTKRKTSSAGSDQSSDTIECFPKRIKLQDLPSFIPLNINNM